MSTLIKFFLIVLQIIKFHSIQFIYLKYLKNKRGRFVRHKLIYEKKSNYKNSVYNFKQF